MAIDVVIEGKEHKEEGAAYQRSRFEEDSGDESDSNNEGKIK